MFEGTTISFIGSGIMAEAMIRGLIDQKVVTPEQIIGSDPYEQRCTELAQKYGIHMTTSNEEAAMKGGIVVLSIKPQSLSKVMPELRGRLQRRDLLLSIMAGVPIKRLADGVAHAAVVRAMPNTPAQIGQGISVWTSTPEVTNEQRGQAQAILESFGEAIFEEDERYLDMATALSGSGPGFVFMFMEAMIDAGVHMGFSRRVASQLVSQTILGSVAYANQSDKHVAELRNQVTSPGGTTAAGLYHMEKGSFRTVVSRALWAAYQRSIELGKGG